MVLNALVISVGQTWTFIKQTELSLLEWGRRCGWLKGASHIHSHLHKGRASTVEVSAHVYH